MQISEGPRASLEGTAKVGRQILWTPEFAAGQGVEHVRQLKWSLVYGSTSYILILVVSRKFALVRLALNGFVIMEKRPNLLNQVCLTSA